MMHECLASITPKHWSDCIDHVKQVEKVYWASDIARDEMLKPVVITLAESDKETDTPYEFETTWVVKHLHVLFRNEIS